MPAQTSPIDLDRILPLLSCPRSGEALHRNGQSLDNQSGSSSYRISDTDIPLFAEHFLSPEAAIQQEHYDHIADAYAANLQYPHTQEYMDEYVFRFNRRNSRSVGKKFLRIVEQIACSEKITYNQIVNQQLEAT